QRSLEVRRADRARVVDVLRQLERALDVLSRGLVIALAPPTAGTPREDVRLERVAGHARALGQRERLVEERDRRRGAVQLIAAAAEAEQHIRALDVGERLRLRLDARLVQQLERLAMGADPHLREPVPDERANLELRDAGGTDGRDQLLERPDRLL